MQNENIQQTSSRSTGKLATPSDIIDVIMEDHKPLKELIKIMKDSDKDFSERKQAFEEFAPTLIAHAKPEEEILYTTMKSNKELREEGFEGDVEHAIADQLVEECKRTTDKDLLSARIKVLAEVVEHHIEEEEEELLPSFKSETDKNLRESLGEKFLTRKLDYLAKGDDNVIPDPKGENLRH